MTKKKDITINIEPCDSEIQRYEGGFTWKFTAPMCSGRNKYINIKCERWWLLYLTEDLKSVLREEIAELNKLKELMGFKE